MVADEDKLANLYQTRCSLCNHNITKNEKRHLVNAEPPQSSVSRFVFVCTQCRETEFDEDGNRS